jgi:hypothetical protein
MKRSDVITIAVNGTTVTTGAASAAVPIPVNQSGNRPLYIRVAATNESYVMLGGASVTATANSLLVQPADAAYLAVGGNTHIAHIQGQNPGKVNITPLEDF